MAVTEIVKDLDNATLTVRARFDAPVERVWDLYADPRKLEKWWGPPTFPATFTSFDLTPGGRVNYHMTGPDGQQYHGLWKVVSVKAPEMLEFDDAFADADGSENPEMPVSHTRITLSEGGGGTTELVGVTTYASSEDLQKTVDMGMEEGLREAMGQMDALLAA